MDWMLFLPRYTVTYCQYGDKRMKPTDIWTNHPNPKFKPMCKNGDPCHEKAPRGSRSGTQGIKGSKLHLMPIPVPSLLEQQRIVSILERFEAFCIQKKCRFFATIRNFATVLSIFWYKAGF